MRPHVSQARPSAPIIRGAGWLAVSIVAWEVAQGVGKDLLPPVGDWPVNPLVLILLVVLPSLVAFAFARLFMAAVVSSYGSLNPYAVVASPWAWVFWLGLGTALVGHGLRIAAGVMREQLPEALSRGEFAARLAFLDLRLGYVLLGLGFFVATAVIMLVGQGTGQRLSGWQRPLLLLASLATYGLAVVYLAVEGRQLIPALAGSVILTGIGFWALPPYELTRDPVGALVVPGCVTAAVVLITWTLLAGGHPEWPW